ncbi:MAG TPA: hypothetical protein VFG71_14335 [Nitrospiraceae bacterium]|nr:hypothetical protein [Nitrospiraceae bacterium]
MRAVYALALLFGAICAHGIEIVDAYESSPGARRAARQAKEGFKAVKQDTSEQKEAFEKEVRRQLNAIQAGMATLQRKVNTASDETRADLQRAITQLESKKAEARKRLEDVHQASASTWSRLRDGMTDFLQEVERSYRDTVSALP